MRQVEYYHAENGKLICDVCPHHCQVTEDKIGICRQRRKMGDRLVAVNYAEAASIALDPIEKKPLYHFHPGSAILSVGANGCNLQCLFCQNCEISQGDVPTRHLPVNELVKMAGLHGSIGVAFTYSEPLMWYEYVLDCAEELHKKGSDVVLVTNGYLEETPLRRLLPLVDAMNIDLKSPGDEFYRKLCKAHIEPVHRTIRLAHAAGVHIEIAHLVVTGWNDRDESILEVARWVASVDPEIPLHLSRYFPHYKYDEPPTSEAFLRRALDLARQELKFVYLGNIAVAAGSDTVCPDCGALIVKRSGYQVKIVRLKDNACAQCGRKLQFKP